MVRRDDMRTPRQGRLPSRAGRRPRRPAIEPLEDRLMLDAGSATTLPQAIVVGRALSTYTTSGLSNNQVTITYTVYNEGAKAEAGVLLKTSLQPGVTLAGASRAPDRSGQDLAWSLGTLQPYGRASVSVTVSLASPTPLQLDGGASAFATVDGAGVSDSTPAAALTGRAIDASLLASAPDANAADPYVQEEAARLDYDPARIFDFLHAQVGYESYPGSLRGARGTLWSGAGNSLDVASLGVALMRASGIPAQYARGTLPYAQAQSLIRSMFPAYPQTAGYLAPGTPTADPANDPALLSEATDHTWFRYDAGSGMIDADPLIAGAAPGRSFATASATFAEVPDSLRQKVEVAVTAEILNTASQAFGLSGTSTTTVLDQTFNAVDLVGHPLTIGNLVNSQSLGTPVFSSTTNVYTPYLIVGGDGMDPSADRLITGTSYQEVRTNFPLGSTVLTGLFLRLTTTGPGQSAETYDRTLADLIGPAIRRNGGSSSTAAGADPLVSPLDLWTVDAESGLYNPHAVQAASAQLAGLQSAFTAFADQLAATPAGPAHDALAAQVIDRFKAVLIAMQRSRLAEFEQDSDAYTQAMAAGMHVRAYLDSPKFIIASSDATVGADGTVRLDLGLDLLKDDIRVLAAPGNARAATIGFNYDRGIMESQVESDVLGDASAASTGTITVGVPLGTPAVFAAAKAQGIPLVSLTPDNPGALDSLNIPADPKALIAAALQAGRDVIVPSQPVTVNGVGRLAWYEIDLSTGETTGVLQDGSHGSIVEFVANQFLNPNSASNQFAEGVFAGASAGSFVKFIVFLLKLYNNYVVDNAHIPAADALANLKNYLSIVLQAITGELEAALIGKPPLFVAGFSVAYLAAIKYAFDPSAEGYQGDAAPRLLPATPNAATATTTPGAGLSAGAVSATLPARSLQVSGAATATWQTSSVVGLPVASLRAGSAQVKDAAGNVVGTGAVAVAAGGVLGATVAGAVSYSVTGQGTLSFYSAGPGVLAVGGEWSSYQATLSGAAAITLTTDRLTVGGVTLPAGTYTIVTSAAQLAGSGAGGSPDFAGSAAVQATGAEVTLDPAGGGSLSIGGRALDPANGLALSGFGGTITVAAGGGADAVTMAGNASGVLQLAAPGTPVSADQNAAGAFQAGVLTSLAGRFDLTATAPEGWTVTVDASGRVTALPAAGLQSGTVPVLLIARSVDDPNLVVRRLVEVNVGATAAGMTLSVAPDSLVSVPVDTGTGAGATVLGTSFGGVLLPSAYRASVHNAGGSADTYNLTFGGVPSGFTVVSSLAGVTVPAGGTSVVGLYLIPTPGQPLPAPGTVLTFNVTATSTSDPSITRTRAVTFTVPAVHDVAVDASATTVGTTPGSPGTITLTITNRGNVAEANVTLSSSAAAGLQLDGLAPLIVSLAPGASVTRTVTLTPSAATPLNSTLGATVTASYGDASSPSTRSVALTLKTVVPGADAIASAAAAAGQLGNAGLSSRLGDLAAALTALVQDPSNSAAKGQALASLDAIRTLASADAYLAPSLATLSADRDALAAATTPQAVKAAVTAIGRDVGAFAKTLDDEASYRFTLGFVTNTQTALPQAPVSFQVVLQNTGSKAATYDLSVAGLPSGVTASFSQASITLAPGQVTPGNGQPTVYVTLTSTSATELDPFTFRVVATVEGAAEISQSATGSLTARQESVAVVSVDPATPFVEPGAKVEVAARVLNAVNQARDAKAYYVVKDSGGGVLFTSSPVTFTLSVLTTLTTVDLRTLDTTGYAKGNLTIAVAVTDLAGNPIAGATGAGTLLIGSPVSVTTTADPATLPAGDGTTTVTLNVTATPDAFSPLHIVGQTPIGGEVQNVVTYGHDAYVATSGGFAIVDVSDPAHPALVSTFTDGIPAGTKLGLDLKGSELIVRASPDNNGPTVKLLIYSLADPAHPALLGQTDIPNLSFQGGPTVVGDTTYLNSGWYRYYIFSGQIFAQFGELTPVDISDPTHPVVGTTLYDSPPDPSTGFPYDGTTNMWQQAAVGDHLLYIGSTTETGGDVDGTGKLLIADATNPNAPTIAGSLLVPGMAQVTGVYVDGNRAVIIGPSKSWGGGVVGLTGKVVVATLDISDPMSPSIIATKTLDRDARNIMYLFPVGGGLIGTETLGAVTDTPNMLILDPTDPADVGVREVSVPSEVLGAYLSGGLLYTSSTSGLIIYALGSATPVPVTASVQVPKGTGVGVVPGSFSVAPTQVIPGADYDTYVWDLSLDATTTTRAITWQESVAGLAPGRSRPVTLGSKADFTSQGTAGSVTAPAVAVAGEQILTLSPGTNSAAPGQTASYTLTVSNPTSASVTYAMSISGVPASWANLPSTITVPAGGQQDFNLALRTDLFTPTGPYGFTVLAAAAGISGTVGGSLTLAGAAAAPAADSRGVVVTLTPGSATAGPGTSTYYTVRVTNTGTTSDTFYLSADLPDGVDASFEPAWVTLSPGAASSRDVTLRVTASRGAAAGTVPISVAATSGSDSSVAAAATGSLTIAPQGVRLEIDPGSAAAGSPYRLLVTNTGTTTETYDLALAGPAGLFAALGSATVTLAPDAWQYVAINTTAPGLALPGSLPLVATATSRATPGVRAMAQADLTIAATTGMSASLTPASQSLSAPGTGSFLILLSNTGNTDDSYSVTIVGTTGGATAALIGPDGRPTQALSLVRLVGLATGSIPLDVTLADAGTGTVTVEIRSLSTGQVSTVTATLTAAATTGGDGGGDGGNGGGGTAADGPRVVLLQRYGVHMMPTSIVLTFDRPLDPSKATDVRAYTLKDAAGRRIAIARAIYDAIDNTVTLKFRQRLNFHRTYTLSVDGASPRALVGVNGQILDGNADGTPGGSYEARLTWRNTVLPTAWKARFRKARQAHAHAHAKPAHHDQAKPAHHIAIRSEHHAK
ncbi:Ubp3 associated protein Bre5 [Aquisphaera giovannonii]|uniref:Ubp3 associated protein Bre5 n=1 Tax=Aquisphaera giovannonii TaxID=406548 RepID=A0A5B9W605_9BACT|nr:transglutaminase domain-containing protein [Aquisphaera giovannonii]QEH35411.1 Ubp3 associated protein Bre5 [Aquisphaera giovannonii]